MWKMESPKWGRSHTLKETLFSRKKNIKKRIEKKKKIKKVTGVRCHNKLENKLSQKEKIVKDTRFQSQ